MVVDDGAGESKVETAARASATSIVTAAPSLAIASIISKGLTIVVAIVGCSIFSGCSSSAPSNPPLAYSGSSRPPVQHVVRPGETVYHLAHVYGVSVQRLLEANHLGDSRDLRVGQSLLIPGSYTYASLGGAESASGTMWNVPRAPRQFAWPLWSGTVTSGFNMTVLPHVLNNGTVMLQFSTDMSNLRRIRTVSSDKSTIETPELDTRNFMQRVAMKSGETLIISGFEQVDDSGERQGVGSPANFLFGGGIKSASNKEVIVILVTPIMMNGA